MKLRFSILNLLLVTTVVVLVVLLLRLSGELEHERALRVALLQKGGILEVSNPDRIHVVKVAAGGERGTLRWRVFVPEGRKITVDGRRDAVPADKALAARLPPNAIVVADRAPVNPVELGPGEHVISFSRSPDDATMMWDVVGDGVQDGHMLSSSRGDLDHYGAAIRVDLTQLEHTPAAFRMLTAGQTLTVDDGETFVLCRYRASQWIDGQRTRDPVKKASEVLLWLHADEP